MASYQVKEERFRYLRQRRSKHTSSQGFCHHATIHLTRPPIIQTLEVFMYQNFLTFSYHELFRAAKPESADG